MHRPSWDVPEMSEVFALARAVEADDVIETGRLFTTCKGKIDSRRQTSREPRLVNHALP